MTVSGHALNDVEAVLEKGTGPMDAKYRELRGRHGRDVFLHVIQAALAKYGEDSSGETDAEWLCRQMRSQPLPVIRDIGATFPTPRTRAVIDARMAFLEAALEAERMHRLTDAAFEAEQRTGKDHDEAHIGAQANAAEDEKDRAYDALMVAEGKKP